MKYIEHVYSNGEPKQFEILNDQVYVPINVQKFTKITQDGEISGYEFDCNVYDKDQYILLLAQRTNRIAELEDELAAAKILLGVDE